MAGNKSDNGRAGAKGVHRGHRQRIIQDFLKHPEDFRDHQLMELLLYYAIPRRDTNPMAHGLLHQFGSLTELLNASPTELHRAGLGDSAVALILLIHTVAQRLNEDQEEGGKPVQTLAQVYSILQPHFYRIEKERLMAICMDGKGKFLGVRMVTEGGQGAVTLSARDVLNVALNAGARNLVLAHNHLSGLALPSEADVESTKEMDKMLTIMGINLQDHVVFADGEMVSMRESGLEFLGERIVFP